MIENNIELDIEDFEPQSPISDVPKWKEMSEMFYSIGRVRVKLNGMVMHAID